MYPNVHAALFTIARTWKQSRCPLTDEWIKKSWYIYTMESRQMVLKNYLQGSSGETKMENRLRDMGRWGRRGGDVWKE